MNASLRTALARVVSPGTLLPQNENIRWGSGGAIPLAVVAPASEEEVADILSTASREGWRVLPAGLGGWLMGGGPVEADLVLSTRRMRGMIEYEPADLTFSAWGGTPLGDLLGAFRDRGQWLPLDPPGGEKGSLGGSVALGASGPLRQGFGTPRDHVLGLTLVTGDGRILRWGGRVVKNVAGFDVTRLAIGSRGSLGVITAVSARLFPLPAQDLTLILEAPTAEDLLPAARALALSSLPLSAIELLDPLPGVDGRRAGLVVRLLGSRAQTEELEARALGELHQEGGALPQGTSVLGRLSGERSRSFHRRLGAWEDGAAVLLRMALLPSRLGDLLEEARTLAALPESDAHGAAQPLRLAVHVGVGILRVAMSAIPTEGPAMATWIRTLREIRERLEQGGGSLILEQGPPGLMRMVGSVGLFGAEGSLVEGLKREFDPQGILAPGRFAPRQP